MRITFEPVSFLELGKTVYRLRGPRPRSADRNFHFSIKAVTRKELQRAPVLFVAGNDVKLLNLGKCSPSLSLLDGWQRGGKFERTGPSVPQTENLAARNITPPAE
jgi:hypothetical protein